MLARPNTESKSDNVNGDEVETEVEPVSQEELERLRWKELTPDDADEHYSRLLDYVDRRDPRAERLANGLAAHAGSVEAVRLELDRRRTTRYGFRQISKAEPYHVMKSFTDTCYSEDGFPTLWYYRSEFWHWREGVYRPYSGDEVKAKLYMFLDRHCKTSNGERIKPDRGFVTKVLDPLRGGITLSSEFPVPCWLDARAEPQPEDVIAFRNGLLDIRNGTLMPHSPRFFTVNILDFPFDPDAAKPQRWEQFLKEVWPRDTDSADTLQEWFGYCLTTDTRMQKALAIIGCARSGKGTIATVQCWLLGDGNVAGPTLASLAGDFGVQPLIGKQLAVIPDARVSNKTDTAPIIEALLAITGEDKLGIRRKNTTDWEGRLRVRLMLLSNGLPELIDHGGVLPTRFIALQMRVSFLGREDIWLSDRLHEELPGIMNWALAGLRRLRERGEFIQPAGGKDLIKRLQEQTTPVKAFVQDRLVVGSDRTASRDAVWLAWEDWCVGADRPVGTKEQLGHNLRIAVEGLKSARLRTLVGRPWGYRGIAVLDV